MAGQSKATVEAVKKKLIESGADMDKIDFIDSSDIGEINSY